LKENHAKIQLNNYLIHKNTSQYITSNNFYAVGLIFLFFLNASAINLKNVSDKPVLFKIFCGLLPAFEKSQVFGSPCLAISIHVNTKRMVKK